MLTIVAVVAVVAAAIAVGVVLVGVRMMSQRLNVERQLARAQSEEQVAILQHRIEGKEAAARASAKRAASAERASMLLQRDIAKVTAEKLVAVEELHAQIDAVKAQLAAAQTDNGTSAALTAAKDADIAQVHAQNVTLVAQLGAKDKQLQQALANDEELKKDRDKLLAEKAENERKLTTVTFERDVCRKNLATTIEVKTDVEAQLEKANETFKRYHLGDALPPEKAALNVVPNVNINGIVRQVRKIDGVSVATISLGSADAVTQGMQFSVVDGGSFLGYFIVDTVTLHDATGFLKGDGIGRVRPNITVVQTQSK